MCEEVSSIYKQILKIDEGEKLAFSLFSSLMKKDKENLQVGG